MKIQVNVKFCLVLLFLILAIEKNNSRKSLKKFYLAKPNSNELIAQHDPLFKKIPLSTAIILGEKKYLNKETKDLFRRLGIYHLMTPSGLHLQILMLLITFLFFNHQRAKYFLFLFIPIFSIDKFYSIKRVLILRLLRFVKFPLPITLRLIITFIYDVISGNFSASWMSSLFSFTALIIIIYSKNKQSTWIEFFIFQVIINMFLNTETKLISLVTSPLFTLISVGLLPIFFLNIIFIQSSDLEFLVLSFIHKFDCKLLYIEQASSLIIPALLLRFFFNFKIFKDKRVLFSACLLFSRITN